MQWVMVMVHTYLLRQADIRSSTGNERAPIQLAQCWFLGLVISNAKILIYFSNKIYGSNFINQHSETVMVWNYQNTDCSLRKTLLHNKVYYNYYNYIYYNFRYTFVPYDETVMCRTVSSGAKSSLLVVAGLHTLSVASLWW